MKALGTGWTGGPSRGAILKSSNLPSGPPRTAHLSTGPGRAEKSLRNSECVTSALSLTHTKEAGRWAMVILEGEA